MDLFEMAVAKSMSGGGEKLPSRCVYFSEYDDYGLPTKCEFIGNWFRMYSGFCYEMFPYVADNMVSSKGLLGHVRTLVINCTLIDNSAFLKCSGLYTVIINEGCTSIGASSFDECLNLKTIIFPSTITTIGQAAFYDCSNMETYDFSKCAQIPSLYNGNSIKGKSGGFDILVPNGLYMQWKNSSGWNNIGNAHFVAV